MTLDRLIEELQAAGRQIGADQRHIEVVAVGQEDDLDDQCTYEIDVPIRCIVVEGLRIRIEPEGD